MRHIIQGHELGRVEEEAYEMGYRDAEIHRIKQDVKIGLLTFFAMSTICIVGKILKHKMCRAHNKL